MKPATLVLGVALVLMGCASTGRQRPPPLDGGFPTSEARVLACLDLQDRLVDLYVADYLRAHGGGLNAPQRLMFRAEWGNELVKRGSFDRFQMSCATSLTKPGYGCAIDAPTPEDVSSCLKRNAEHPPRVQTDDPRRTG